MVCLRYLSVLCVVESLEGQTDQGARYLQTGPSSPGWNCHHILFPSRAIARAIARERRRRAPPRRCGRLRLRTALRWTGRLMVSELEDSPGVGIENGREGEVCWLTDWW